jgi:hypothetical protein
MNIQELTTLLARIQVLDNRQVDELTIHAWAPLMADVPYANAVQAVNAHFRESTEYLKPGHITQRVWRAMPKPTSSPRITDCGNHRRLPDGTCTRCEHRDREVSV